LSLRNLRQCLMRNDQQTAAMTIRALQVYHRDISIRFDISSWHSVG
jgi:hypothetical protein